MFTKGTPFETHEDRPLKRTKRKLSDDDDGAEPPPDGAPPEAMEEVPVTMAAARLAGVEILDGDDQTELAADAVQFVNLPRDVRWVDGPVPNIDRLGRALRVRVRFDQPGVHRFRARLLADGGNAVYSETEKGRPEFACDLGEHEYQTGGDGTVILDQPFVLPAAGRNTFWIEARDEQGPAHSSHRVVTHRLLYCQELVMEGVTAAENLDDVVAELGQQNITLVPLTRAALPARPNIDVEINDGAQERTFLAEMDLAFASSPGAAKAPYVLIVAYVRSLALKKKLKLKAEVEVGPEKPDAMIPVRMEGIDHYLWIGIDADGWLAAVRFGPTGEQPQPISYADRCTAEANDHHYPDQCRRIRVRVSDLAPAKGTLELYISLVKKTLGGVSFGNATPRICLATRAGWTDVPPAKQQVIVLHEIGHKLGMVPDGTGALDRLPLQYSHTHVGSHCHEGLQEAMDYDQYQIGQCVMFGEALTQIRTFCAACADALRKADLGAGWTP